MRDAGTPMHTRDEDSHRVPNRDIDETVRLGREIYERDIRRKVEPDHVGEFIAVDVDSGCWALGDSVTDAVKLLREQRPEAVDTLCERVGYRALRSFGAGSLRITE
jgi:hypothetical protein